MNFNDWHICTVLRSTVTIFGILQNNHNIIHIDDKVLLISASVLFNTAINNLILLLGIPKLS